MMRRWILPAIAAALIGIAALVFLYPRIMVAPGPLIPAHTSLETNCFACHTPFQGVTAEKCATCHAIATIGLQTTKGVPIARTTPVTPFHQGLTSAQCMACHADHTNPALISREQPAFSHALLAPAIRETCASCHTPPATAVHSGATTATCTQCHSQERWKPATFDHTRFFVLDQDHNAACTTCHTTNNQREYTCYGCHEHTQANIQAKHRREGIQNITNCVSCHRSAHGGNREGGGREDGDDD
jgi:hypothetical protein